MDIIIEGENFDDLPIIYYPTNVFCYNIIIGYYYIYTKACINICSRGSYTDNNIVLMYTSVDIVSCSIEVYA